MLQQDHGRLIGNAVNWALSAEPRVQVSGTGLVDVAVHENKDGLAVCLVNLSNPMTMRGPIRETLPLGGQEVSIALPRGAAGVVTARLLVSGVDVPVTIEAGRASAIIPALYLLEVLELCWA